MAVMGAAGTTGRAAAPFSTDMVHADDGRDGFARHEHIGRRNRNANLGSLQGLHQRDFLLLRRIAVSRRDAPQNFITFRRAEGVDISA